MKLRTWPVTLEDDDIVLNPLTYGDEREWKRMHGKNRQWLAAWDATAPFPGAAPRSFRDMIKSGNSQARQGAGLPFALRIRQPELRGSLELIGQVNVSNIVYASLCSGVMGYWISEEYAGRGIVPHAAAIVIDHCFKFLRLHRVEVNIRPENTPSLRVVEKLGFREEGYRRRYVHIGGQWADHLSFAITAEEVPEGMLNRYTSRCKENHGL